MTLSDRVAALERRLDVLDAELRELTQAVLDGAQADRQSVVEVVQLLTARQSLRAPRPRPSDGPVSAVRRQVAQWVALVVVGVLGAAGATLARSCGVPSIAPPPVPGATGGAPP